jgi:hypothetical protein
MHERHGYWHACQQCAVAQAPEGRQSETPRFFEHKGDAAVDEQRADFFHVVVPAKHRRQLGLCAI